MTSDFYWIKNGFFYNLIPNNPEAEKIWCQIDEVFSGCNIPLSAWPNVKTQITNAGYSVRKNRKMKPITDNELDMILSELGVGE